MDTVKAGVALAFLLVPFAAPARSSVDPVARWSPYVAEASARFDIPADWIGRVISAESAGSTTLNGKPIRSRAGAMGLMQLMPATWATMRVAYRLGSNPDDPRDNIIAGTAFLRMMYDRFGYPGMFAAYNAGPARYAAYLAGRSRLPDETIGYLRGVTGRRSTLAATGETSPRQLLFVLRHDLKDAQQPPAEAPARDDVFAIRRSLQ